MSRKRNPPFPEGLTIVQKLLQENPEFGPIAAAGGLTAVQVLLKPAPKNPSKSKALPHLAVGTVAVVNADSLGLIEGANGTDTDPLFRITVREEMWAKLTPRGREAAMYTFLTRMSVVEPEDDSGDDGDGVKCSLVPFAIQTFDTVLDKYGRWDLSEVRDLDGDDGTAGEDSDDKPRRAGNLNPDALAVGSTDE